MMNQTLVVKLFLFTLLLGVMGACGDKKADSHNNRKSDKNKRYTAPAARETAEADDMSDGTMLHNIPDSMRVGKKQRIEVRLSRGQDRISIVKSVRGSQKVKIQEIKVGKAMGVKLIASPNEFEVLKHSSEIQAVSRRGYTLWEWDVTPIKEGKHDLYLKVIVRKGSYNKDLPVLDKSVQVVTTETKRWTSFFNDNKVWSMGSLVIPLLIFIFSRLGRRNPKPAPKKTTTRKKPAAKKKSTPRKR
jgi:hypothetical protein